MEWSKCYKAVFEWNRKKSVRNFIQIYALVNKHHKPTVSHGAGKRCPKL